MPVPTRRLAALFVISAIVLALSASGQPETWIVVLSILVGVAIVDLAMAVRPRTIEVRREVPRSSPWEHRPPSDGRCATRHSGPPSWCSPTSWRRRWVRSAPAACATASPLDRHRRSRSATDTPRRVPGRRNCAAHRRTPRLGGPPAHPPCADEHQGVPVVSFEGRSRAADQQGAHPRDRPAFGERTRRRHRVRAAPRVHGRRRVSPRSIGRRRPAGRAIVRTYRAERNQTVHQPARQRSGDGRHVSTASADRARDGCGDDAHDGGDTARRPLRATGVRSRRASRRSCVELAQISSGGWSRRCSTSNRVLAESDYRGAFNETMVRFRRACDARHVHRPRRAGSRRIPAARAAVDRPQPRRARSRRCRTRRWSAGRRPRHPPMNGRLPKGRGRSAHWRSGAAPSAVCSGLGATVIDAPPRSAAHSSISCTRI